MKPISKEQLALLHKQYPAGTRVELLLMDDTQAPPAGTKGTVWGIDDTGSIMVHWDNGSGLNVIFGIDSCKIIEETTIWREGSIKVGNSIIRYWIKCFKEGSQYGIDKGRISKLMLKRNGEIIANYDRGWDIMPVDSDAEIALSILMKEHN